MNWRGLNFRQSDESRFNIFLRYQFQSVRFGRFSSEKGNNILCYTNSICFLSGLAYGSLEKDLFCQMK